MGFGVFWSSRSPRGTTTETDGHAPHLEGNFGMHVLYDGTKPPADPSLGQEKQDNQPCLEPVDIIAVHGLLGDPIKTWTHLQSGVMWLEALLSVALPRSRIMSYGYDARIYESKSTLHIMDNAQDLLSEIQAKRTSQTLRSRRIIFIGHSLGGIVIKKALIMAREEKQYCDLLDSTIGVMFMGTPHDGADGAKLVKTAAKIANTLMKLNANQLETLERGSVQLQDISRSFGYLESLKIVTVLESDETKIPYIGRRLVRIVEPASARLNLGDRENVLSVIRADHHTVCKFRGVNDRQYHKIKDAMINLASSPVVSKSSDVIEDRKRLLDSIDAGSAKIQKITNEGFHNTKSSLAALENQSNTQNKDRIRESMLRIFKSDKGYTEGTPTKGTPETGLTFLQRPEYQNWKKSPASFLWLHGKSGIGKTVLCSTITKDLLDNCVSKTTNSAAASVFCSWGDQDVAILISRLLSKLIRRVSNFPQEAADLIEKYRDRSVNEANLSIGDLSETLHWVLTLLDCAYIMIDGLDEWSLENGRRSRLLEWIVSLEGWNLPQVHVLVTSQNLPDIERTLDVKGTLSNRRALRIDSRQDILIHVKHEFHTDQQLARFDQSLKTDIEDFLIAGSDEGFRWVALQLMELRSCRASRDAREALQSLPKTLKETYDRILDKVPERDRPYVRAALQWIACSARPLSLDELAVVAVIDPAVAKGNDLENRLVEGGKTIHDMLSKLIDVRKVSHGFGLLFKRSPPGEVCSIDYEINELEPQTEDKDWPDFVKFSHSSVRDYLLQWHDNGNVSSSFCFSEDMAHRFIAKSCLVLCQDTTKVRRDGNRAYYEGLACLKQYLAGYWHTHAARLPDEEPGSLAHVFNEVPKAMSFLLAAYDECWEETFGAIVGFDESKGKPPSPQQKLQYAACIGSSCIVDIIFASHPDLDVNATVLSLAGIFRPFLDDTTALSLACERGHRQIADKLLNRGADPNKGNWRITPLVGASAQGANDFVQQLISHGANVNMRCESDSEDTPLTAAIAACHPRTVELLLTHGADPNLISSMGTPASLAAGDGKHECMDLLLKHGASLEPWIIDDPSLLESACVSGSIKTVRLLLEQGMDVHDTNCLLPLNMDKRLPAAIYRFNYPFVFLKESGSNCTYCWQCYGSPMHVAAAKGHTEIVKLLVENNAPVNEKSHYWQTPSTLARLRGHKETLEYLLSKGGETSDEVDVCYRRDLFCDECEKDKYGNSVCHYRGAIGDRQPCSLVKAMERVIDIT